MRVVRVRTGVVLDARGGALAKMLPPFKMGVGGKVGNGRQWMSWIHAEDLAGIFRLRADDQQVSGADERGRARIPSRTPISRARWRRR